MRASTRIIGGRYTIPRAGKLGSLGAGAGSARRGPLVGEWQTQSMRWRASYDACLTHSNNGVRYPVKDAPGPPVIYYLSILYGLHLFL